MLEFSSISVSSYDAASLADKLTEKSGDGWSVVSVVAAGTNVTAYLSRERSHAGVGADAGSATAGGYDTAVVDDDVTAVGDAEPTFEPVLPASSSAAAVAEPAGWAVEPEPVSSGTSSGDTTTWESGSSAADVEPSTSTTTAESAAYGTAAAGAMSEGGQATSSEPASSAATSSQTDSQSVAQTGSQSTASDAGQTTAASSAATAPAGWYADPSGRYELRYWDGTQWTEHVSRAGQQYTDPPVA